MSKAKDLVAVEGNISQEGLKRLTVLANKIIQSKDDDDDKVLCTGCYTMVKANSLRSPSFVNAGFCPECMKALKEEMSEEVLVRVRETLHKIYLDEDVDISIKNILEREFAWIEGGGCDGK